MIRTTLLSLLLLVPLSLRADEPEPRDPIAMVVSNHDLLVACRNGVLARVDPSDGHVTHTQRLAEAMTDLQLCGKRLLAIDPAKNELLLIAPHATGWSIVARQRVPTDPVSVIVNPAGNQAIVASRWARQLAFVEITDATLKIRATLDLPFSPGRLWLAPDGRRLVAADAFAGDLAAVNVPTARLISIRSVEGHNLRGLLASADGNRLQVAQQLLGESTPTERNRVFWGSVVSNILRSVELDTLFDSSAFDPKRPVRAMPHWQLEPLGGSGRAAGDPGMLLARADGLLAVALSGVDEVGIRPPRQRGFTRVKVGDRPVALAFSQDRQTLYVANQFDDSISVIDLNTLQVRQTVSLASRRVLTSEQRGERLFFDARLSLDGWFSCHSCHVDGHTNGRLNDNSGDDTFGTPKRVLSLLGTGQTGPWAWNGNRGTLEEQIRKSIEQTMHGAENRPVPVQTVVDLAAYIRRLKPAPGIDAARRRLDHDAIARGKAIFEERDCAQCHARPEYTAPKVFDVGLIDERDARHFNPPSLLGVSQRRRFFHDNRAATLRDVFSRHRHAGTDDLTGDELAHLLAFLRSL